MFEEMVSYCQKALPYEACGLLSGYQATGNTLWKMKNESHNLNRFYMSAGSIKHAFEHMEEKEEELSGIFHSHPSSPAVPSSFDIENNPYPDLAYIIVSFYKGKVDVGCFRIKSDGKVLPLELIVTEE